MKCFQTNLLKWHCFCPIAACRGFFPFIIFLNVERNLVCKSLLPFENVRVSLACSPEPSSQKYHTTAHHTQTQHSNHRYACPTHTQATHTTQTNHSAQLHIPQCTYKTTKHTHIQHLHTHTHRTHAQHTCLYSCTHHTTACNYLSNPRVSTLTFHMCAKTHPQDTTCIYTMFGSCKIQIILKGFPLQMQKEQQ